MPVDSWSGQVEDRHDDGEFRNDVAIGGKPEYEVEAASLERYFASSSAANASRL